MINITKPVETLHHVNLLRNGRAGERTWRNFKGEGGPNNTPGNRNFTIGLDDEKAAELRSHGWPVRSKPDTRPGHEGEERHTLKVNVKYRTRDGREMKPPKIVVITRRNRTEYGENQVELLDFMEFSNVDVTLNAYPTVNSFTKEEMVGVSLMVMFATVEEDELTAEYNARWEDEDTPFN